MSLKTNLTDIENKLNQNSDKWVFANSILYDMCKDNPKHNDANCIVAKIWLIGRSYAAAIERRKNKDASANDDFYYDVVAPGMLEIGEVLDERIQILNTFSEINIENLPYILETHKILMDAFYKMTKLEKRSLASKYLHFHCPNLFFIYDSRANNSIKKFVKKDKYTPKLKYSELYDKEYYGFCLRVLELQNGIKSKTGVLPTPRMLDGILLGY